METCQAKSRCRKLSDSGEVPIPQFTGVYRDSPPLTDVTRHSRAVSESPRNGL